MFLCSTFSSVMCGSVQLHSFLCYSLKQGLTHISTLHFRCLNFVLISLFIAEHTQHFFVRVRADCNRDFIWISSFIPSYLDFFLACSYCTYNLWLIVMLGF
jgi:hypothetical protein